MMADNELPKLSPRHQAFVDHYLGDCRFDATKAAIAAGFSVRRAAPTGCDVKKRNDVRAHIDHRLAEDAMSGAEVLAELTDVARRGLNEFIDVRTYGDEVSAKMDASAKMKALELLGKAHQLFVERQVVEGDVTITRILGVSDEDIA